ncbi:accessory factor associated with RNA polymerase II [Cadophora gregata]|uniref:accessory factor associated with RNA polymerase II n=1 Tax=Cadophora gregata TaxID=51156 RepID=UPI0026DAAE9D|nr:accessory factor associated with RNA polymerase II [Cadophora gregata]KAK0102891.1 accessory factor associated with RNA polymerase II [Cadophora gregata f. sp. sojae]KAK0128971.1 accessory factor associated with RNA polymerase II [Cadophora gregata]
MRNNDLVPPPRTTPVEAKNRELDLSAYFLVRRASTESDAVSPKFGGSRAPSYRKSPKSPKSKSQKSGCSSHGPRTKRNSISSAQSIIAKNQAIRDWNDKSIGVTSPSSAGCLSSHSVDPPRPPRAGCEWVWFPEGYWAEREVTLPRKAGSRQKWWSRSPERKSKSSTTTQPSERAHPSTELPTIKIGSLMSRKSSTTKSPKVEHSSSTSRKSSGIRIQSIRHQFNVQSKKPVPAYYGIPPDEHLGLYCRAKKTVRSRFMQKATTVDDSGIVDVNRITSRTTMLLQGTSQYLDRAEQESCQASKPCLPPEAPQTPGSSSLRSFRRFGLAPWHRKTSHESILSASSSVFKLLLGKAPAVTPNPDYQYEGTDGKTYLKVDIASPDPIEPTFLPSEAKRVNTPPMFPGTPDLQPRGFFFDLKPRGEGSISTSPVSSSSNAAAKNRSNGTSPSIEWWEADTQHASTGNKSARLLNIEIDAPMNQSPRASFELNLPEHLPNSPLCPKNPMNESGGTVICPYHGRKRRNHLMNINQSELESQDSSTTPSGKTSTRNIIG